MIVLDVFPAATMWTGQEQVPEQAGADCHDRPNDGMRQQRDASEGTERDDGADPLAHVCVVYQTGRMS